MTVLALENAMYLDVTAPGFSMRGPEVRRAREMDWFARTDYGIAVLRYEEMNRLLKHTKLRHGAVSWPALNGVDEGPLPAWFERWILNKEGEEHHRLRRLLNPAFARGVARSMVPRFHQLATDLVEGFEQPDTCEFMAEFAEPYAARAIAIMLGLPEKEWPQIAEAAATVGLSLSVRFKNEVPRIESALQTLYGYADRAIKDRRREGRDDLVTALIAAETDDSEGLSTEEMRDILVLLTFGGFDTTRNQLGLAVQTFLDHPAQWQLLAERPELGNQAVEEAMRVNPTMRWISREAMETFDFQDLQITAGSTLLLFTESAGTDPRAFGETSFDITAERKHHFGFGGGPHYCLGHFIARADMSVALPFLAARMRDLRPAGPAVMLPDSCNTGPVELPLAFKPRP